MEKSALLEYICSSCKKHSYPRGQYLTKLPYVGYVKCPFCGYEENEVMWTDSNIHTEIIRKRYKLNENEDYNQIFERVSCLEERCVKIENENILLKQTLELERQARDLLEKEIAESRAFRERFERDLVTLESLIDLKTIEKRDKDKFQEENK